MAFETNWLQESIVFDDIDEFFEPLTLDELVHSTVGSVVTPTVFRGPLAVERITDRQCGELQAGKERQYLFKAVCRVAKSLRISIYRKRKSSYGDIA